MRHFLEFEKPIAELEGKIEELRRTTDAGGIDVAEEIGRLGEKAQALLKTTYAKLSPWQKAQVARHPDRPHTTDYFADDAAVVGGMGRFRGRAVMVLGTERGHDTDSRVKHNFGMARPEGYRKARRLMELAGRFGMPILSFVDTSGAFPGIDAEARGQAEAIARSIEAGLDAPVPFIATIIGEGGSGGAIALAAADRIIMLEHAIYSVISPEGCASILWRDAAQAATAAEALKLTADDLRKLGLVDVVVPEPLGGAHRDAATVITALGDKIETLLTPLLALDGATLRARRRDKFLEMGRSGAL
jgi:acetyl-CoA carboxylase carboxyl transferase subunit alpha